MTAFSYFRVVVPAAVATVGLAFLLNIWLHAWPAAATLAAAGVVELITLVLAVRTLVRWIIDRRKPDDDTPGYQDDFGLAA